MGFPIFEGFFSHEMHKWAQNEEICGETHAYATLLGLRMPFKAWKIVV